MARIVVVAFRERLQRAAVEELLAAQEPLVIVERLLKFVACRTS
jgi:hypothetical protein